MYLQIRRISWLSICVMLLVSLSFSPHLTFANETVQPSIEEELMEERAPGFLPTQANPPQWAKAWERAGKPNSLLREGNPQSVQMLPSYIDQMDDVIESGIEEEKYPGAVALVVKDGTIVKHEAYGHALKYDEDSALLSEQEQIATETDTIYDMASITKIFTSVASLQLVEKGLIDLDEQVASYLSEVDESNEMTIRQLLTHTSGLPAWIPIYTYPTLEERLQAIYETDPVNEPGTVYVYSDLNMILLGKVIEKVADTTLDNYIAEQITQPLGMKDTMFNPDASLQTRIAATEPQPYLDRGMVWGSVHDENAFSLNGVAGHAGIFSTAEDMAIFSQAILNGGTYGQAQILKDETVTEMLTNQITDESHLAQGLGWHLDRSWFMGAMSSPFTAGHTGFTGTSFVIDPDRETIVIFLTNRVHPTREAGSINPWREQVVQQVVDAIDQHPSKNGLR
ncbi:serine hydrolase [Salipaludibacillus keqinensis]|uniref:Serine hydrolase n=1 Tax=Salipaludibacillus keqinensis TaxID=2045207 RepID=A0A323TGW7_9BACI|nr:serine hydrolase [Salipaludibacillus keqinensis]PYZ92807.1 serine hydrolase [Salipaludibacillus keqinensis]